MFVGNGLDGSRLMVERNAQPVILPSVGRLDAPLPELPRGLK